ncbi:MAG: hypothetical protein ACT4TC_11795 [Myxococcaceae bacterium]
MSLSRSGNTDVVQRRNIRRWAALLCWIGSGAAFAQSVASGSFTGNNTTGRFISVGFQPAFVIVKGNQALGGMVRSASMLGDLSKCINCAQPLETEGIQSFNSTGFVVGSGDRSNGQSVAFQWVAFRAVAGEMTTGSYTGNNVDGRSITVGFAPDAVFVIPDAAQTTSFRFSSMAGTTSYTLGTGSGPGRINAFNATGFVLGTDPAVNAGATTYHWVAFKSGMGRTGVGTYTGNGTDNRVIAGMGFNPNFAMVRIAANARTVMRTSALGGDSTIPISSETFFANGIQALQSGGFQVGTTTDVNASGSTYYYFATGTTLPAAPTVQSNAATSISTTSATLNGQAVPNNLSSTGWFRYSTTNPGSCNDAFGTRIPTSGGTALGAGTNWVPYSQSPTGLTSGVTYYFCAIASNSNGTSFGALQTFVPPGSPVVTSSAASAITRTTATLNGSANPRGAATTGWFRYSSTMPTLCNDAFGTRVPASGGTALGSGTSAVPFNQPISGLTGGTTYYFCALASNAQGNAVGSVLSFVAPTTPSVTTSAATAVNSTTTTLNGAASPNGAATTGYFRYSATNPGTCNDTFGTRAPSAGGTSLGAGTGSTTFNQPITGLTGGTTYFY